jgi:hypothetical protein
MTSLTVWRCRSETCGAVLGAVRDGALHLSGVELTLDRRGGARVRCPRCGAVRIWKPVMSGLTEDRPTATASSRA